MLVVIRRIDMLSNLHSYWDKEKCLWLKIYRKNHTKIQSPSAYWFRYSPYVVFQCVSNEVSWEERRFRHLCDCLPLHLLITL